MGKKIIIFGDIEVEKQKFHQHKIPIWINNVDISKIVVSNMVNFGKKGLTYFVGYKDGKYVRPLWVMLPKMSTYRRDFDETKYMSFLIKNHELLEKYNEIWEKVSNSIKKGLYSEPVYNEKYI